MVCGLDHSGSQPFITSLYTLSPLLPSFCLLCPLPSPPDSLSGTSPFFSDNTVMVVDRIKEARYDFYGEHFEQISTEAKEFISALLQKSPEYRMSASQALQHDWVTVSSSSITFDDRKSDNTTYCTCAWYIHVVHAVESVTVNRKLYNYQSHVCTSSCTQRFSV